MLAHFTITIQDHIIPQTKDDDIQAVIAIVNEEVAKPFFSWPFGGGQTAASDSSKNKERETTLQLASATKAEPVTQTVLKDLHRIQGYTLTVVANSC